MGDSIFFKLPAAPQVLLLLVQCDMNRNLIWAFRTSYSMKILGTSTALLVS
jgi:hypothetical protein